MILIRVDSYLCTILISTLHCLPFDILSVFNTQWFVSLQFLHIL
ncbi:hypothetical protein U0070_025636 [Myodes glareolus]|uniref:Uncharacterized protein n=1 Tax=Myodes glareolus TaxID=447135 RepID=A0AAW0I4W9_MYOGA